jgi:hypothetical protein
MANSDRGYDRFREQAVKGYAQDTAWFRARLLWDEIVHARKCSDVSYYQGLVRAYELMTGKKVSVEVVQGVGTLVAS